MSDKPISDLRRRMIADMTVRSFSEKTQASALRFFFTITLGRADRAHQLAGTHCPRKLPRGLAREQVARLIEAAPGPGLKYKTALSIAGACPRAGRRPDPWGAGLRGGEVGRLRVGDIDSKRMLIGVERGKGRKDRHAMLSPQLLLLLRA
jgi:integrase/recombinase XerD